MATVKELLDEASAALDLVDRDERAARLFVVAGRLQATGDEAATAEARALLTKAARDGSSYAAFDLAMLLFAGRGGPVETEAALGWLEHAAGELPAAAVTLGGMLLFDPESAPEGISWLRRAAKSGEPSAFWLLGAAHLRGLGVAADAQQARVLLAAAAEAGVTEAQLEL
ncbi:MAG: tetratricopeptide repeat protein, partial [Polyangia bacterium]